MLYLLDYGAGNVASLANTLTELGHEYKWVSSPEEIETADQLIFPGVGAFGAAMASLRAKGFYEPLKRYIASGKPYFGICIGMQTLFESSTENPEESGLGVIPAAVGRFNDTNKAVPCIGWNAVGDAYYYFVHSYRVAYDPASEACQTWARTVTRYGDETYVSSVAHGNVFATQFHPEKSGRAGLALIDAWIRTGAVPESNVAGFTGASITKRVVACLDVRSNDSGDLVVTKGDQYDVRETSGDKGVRNLGKPVELAKRYFDEGADEICFLNITSFRECPLDDQPMVEVVRAAAKTVFVPLTVGGGIRDTVDPDGTKHSALEVASLYFRSGADKVSIGGDAVEAVEQLLQSRAGAKDAAAPATSPNPCSITAISTKYGAQAVVVSIDPKRVYVNSPDDVAPAHRPCVVDLSTTDASKGLKPDLGPNGEAFCWYQCTVKGGRETRDIDVVQLAQGVAELGAGELLLNSVDKDGSKSGFDLRLVNLVKAAVSIPIVASSGAGQESHFKDLFEFTQAEAGLAAGIFHRNEVPLANVKSYLIKNGIRVPSQ